MPEDNMTQERETLPQVPPEVESTEPEIPVENLMDHSLFIGLPQIPRRAEIRERRETEARELFEQNVNLLDRLRVVSHRLSNSPVTNEEKTEFPDPQKFLLTYQSASDTDKKRYQSGIRMKIEITEKKILRTLETDISLLSADRGFSAREIEKTINDVTTGMDKKKRRKHILQLDKESQVALLENATRFRDEMLVSNFETYMYFLSYSDYSKPSQKQDRLTQFRKDEFDTADDETKATISAKTRELAEEGLGFAFYVNIERLTEIEKNKGKNEKQIDNEMRDLYKSFEKGTLASKAKILDRIQRRKLSASIEWAGDVNKLKAILIETTEASTEEHKEDLTDEQHLQNDVDDIIFIITRECKAFINNSYGEIHVEDTEDVVKGLAEELDDPSIIDTYDLVLQLRFAPHNIFEL